MYVISRELYVTNSSPNVTSRNIHELVIYLFKRSSKVTHWKVQHHHHNTVRSVKICTHVLRFMPRGWPRLNCHARVLIRRPIAMMSINLLLIIVRVSMVPMDLMYLGVLCRFVKFLIYFVFFSCLYEKD